MYAEFAHPTARKHVKYAVLLNERYMNPEPRYAAALLFQRKQSHIALCQQSFTDRGTIGFPNDLTPIELLLALSVEPRPISAPPPFVPAPPPEMPAGLQAGLRSSDRVLARGVGSGDRDMGGPGRGAVVAVTMGDHPTPADGPGDGGTPNQGGPNTMPHNTVSVVPHLNEVF
jgi:hypothetical protein